MIQLKNVYKAFGPKKVLQGFTLDIPELKYKSPGCTSASTVWPGSIRRR